MNKNNNEINDFKKVGELQRKKKRKREKEKELYDKILTQL